MYELREKLKEACTLMSDVNCSEQFIQWTNEWMNEIDFYHRQAAMQGEEAGVGLYHALRLVSKLMVYLFALLSMDEWINKF